MSKKYIRCLILTALISIPFLKLAPSTSQQPIDQGEPIFAIMASATLKPAQSLPASTLKTVPTLSTVYITPKPVVATPVVQATSTAYDSALASWLYALRMCESGGNYAEDTGNGFFGAYQFTLATWDHWNTAYANPIDAPPSVQDATIIENTNASAGLVTQNPGCYAITGISNYPPN